MVFDCKSVGEVYGHERILDRMKCSSEVIFSLSSSEFLADDLSSVEEVDVTIGHDPFNGLNLKQTENAMLVLDKARRGLILSLPCNSFGQYRLAVLGQFGRVVPFYYGYDYTHYLVMK